MLELTYPPVPEQSGPDSTTEHDPVLAEAAATAATALQDSTHDTTTPDTTTPDTGEDVPDELEGPTNEQRRSTNAQLRVRFLKCNAAIKAAQLAQDTDAEAAARRERERVGEEFVRANPGLAMAAARPMLGAAGGDRGDHVQAAMLGMWEAFVGTDPDKVDDVEVDDDGQVRPVAGWDPSRGTFGNYSRVFISGRTRRSVRSSEGAYTGMSYNAWGARPKVLKARAELLAETGKMPSAKQIAARAELTEATVATVLTAGPVSLDKPVGEEGGSTLGDLVAQKEATAGSDELARLEALLVDRAEDLGPLDLFVFLLHTGALLDRPPRSLVQTGDTLGIGRGAVQLAYKRALATLTDDPDAGSKDLLGELDEL